MSFLGGLLGDHQHHCKELKNYLDSHSWKWEKKHGTFKNNKGKFRSNPNTKLCSLQPLQLETSDL